MKYAAKINRPLLALFAIALFVRLFVIIMASSDQNRFLCPDSYDYISLADNICNSGQYAKGVEPEIFRVPGYPAFIAPFRWIMPDNLLPIVLLQALIDTCTCVFLWFLVKNVFKDNDKAANFAIFFQAFSVAAIVFSAKILSETIFTFTLTLFLLLLEKIITFSKSKCYQKTLNAAISAGLCMGASCLIRAVMLPLIPLSVIYIYFHTKRAAIFACFFIPIFVITGIWTLRNYYTAGYLGLSSVNSINIYRYYACALLAKQKGISFAEQQGLCDTNLGRFSTEVEQAKFAKTEGFHILKSAPFAYAWIHLKSDMHSLLPAIGDLFKLCGLNLKSEGTLSVLNSQGLIAGVKHYFNGNRTMFFLAIPAVILLGIKYLSFIIAFAAQRKKIKVVYIFHLLILCYFVLTPGPASHPRFRVPVEPILALYAGLGLATIIELIFSRFSTKPEKSQN